MANTNTFAAFPNNLAANFSSTETAVQSPVGVMGPLGASTSGTPLRQLLSVPPDVSGGIYDGRPFKMRVIAQGTASGAGNFVVNTYWNKGANTNLTTFTNDVLVIGSGNAALASTTGYVFMEAVLFWDSTLQQLAAFWNETAGLADVVTTPAIIKTTAAVTATDPVASSLTKTDSLQFFVTTSISANGTGAKLVEFSLDRI